MPKAKVDYRARAEAELQKALDYPVGQPNKSAWKNKYRAALRRALRCAWFAFRYRQWTKEEEVAFKRRVNVAWK